MHATVLSVQVLVSRCTLDKQVYNLLLCICWQPEVSNKNLTTHFRRSYYFRGDTFKTRVWRALQHSHPKHHPTPLTHTKLRCLSAYIHNSAHKRHPSVRLNTFQTPASPSCGHPSSTSQARQPSSARPLPRLPASFIQAPPSSCWRGTQVEIAAEISQEIKMKSLLTISQPYKPYRAAVGNHSAIT